MAQIKAQRSGGDKTDNQKPREEQARQGDREKERASAWWGIPRCVSVGMRLLLLRNIWMFGWLLGRCWCPVIDFLSTSHWTWGCWLGRPFYRCGVVFLLFGGVCVPPLSLVPSSLLRRLFVNGSVVVAFGNWPLWKGNQMGLTFVSGRRVVLALFKTLNCTRTRGLCCAHTQIIDFSESGSAVVCHCVRSCSTLNSFSNRRWLYAPGYFFQAPQRGLRFSLLPLSFSLFSAVSGYPFSAPDSQLLGMRTAHFKLAPANVPLSRWVSFLSKKATQESSVLCAINTTESLSFSRRIYGKCRQGNENEMEIKMEKWRRDADITHRRKADWRSIIIIKRKIPLGENAKND